MEWTVPEWPLVLCHLFFNPDLLFDGSFPHVLIFCYKTKDL